MKTEKLKKSLKGGTILGSKGRDGFVVEPAKLCHHKDKNKLSNNHKRKINKIKNKNLVSKIININNVSRQDLLNYRKEFVIGDRFLDIDENNQHFIYGLDMCAFRTTELFLREYGLYKNIEEVYNKNNQYNLTDNPIKLLNIVMKKGQDFYMVTINLNRKDLFRSIYYLINGAIKCVHQAETCLHDIKYQNLLYSNDPNDSKIYPVFIDFSYDFVTKSFNQFKDFINTHGENENYIFPYEVKIIYLLFNKEERIKYLRERKGEERKYAHGLIRYMNNLLGQSLLLIYEKIMVYLIGNSYRESLSEKNENDLVIAKLISKMIKEDPRERPTFNEIKEYIDKIYNFNDSRENILINPKKSFLNKFKKYIKKDKISKNLLKKIINN